MVSAPLDMQHGSLEMAPKEKPQIISLRFDVADLQAPFSLADWSTSFVEKFQGVRLNFEYTDMHHSMVGMALHSHTELLYQIMEP